MSKENDDDKRIIDAALGGDTSLHGANKDQVAALGGEVDDDLDNFKPTAADRGDLLPDEVKAAAEKEAADKAAAEKAAAEKEAAEKAAKDAEEKAAADKAAAEKEAAEKAAKDGEDDDADEETDDDKADDNADADGKGDKDGDRTVDDKAGDKKKPGKPEGDWIPKSRFDEVNARRKDAEEKLRAQEAEARAKKEGAVKEFDFDKAEIEYGELILSGKTKEAMAKRKEIRAAEKAAWEAEATDKAVETVVDRQASADIAEVIADAEQTYNEFNPEHESFSEDLVDEVGSAYAGYLATRPNLTKQQAFTLAIDKTARLYGLRKVGEPAPDKGDKGDKGSDKNPTRLKDKKDTKAKVDLAAKAPADTSKVGDAGDKGGDLKYDINQMTDAELDALPESTLKRLRGDILP